LARSPFVDIQQRTYPFDHVWTVDSIAGDLYSTSYAARPLFGDHVGDFEQDVREALLSLNPDGVFPERIVADALLAWKRASESAEHSR
jgi:hypothetical protein